MKDRKLVIPKQYDVSSQRLVGMFAAQLDDQLRYVNEAVAGLDTKHLEWQPHAGVNTAGMLLAHLAVSEAFWINVAVAEIPLEPDGDNLIMKTIGIRMDDDGLPLAPEGLHPATLSGKSREYYLGMLERARRATHDALRTWNDSDLERAYRLRDNTVTRSWTLYHLLEHFAVHRGQILLLKHLMRDANVLEKKKD